MLNIKNNCILINYDSPTYPASLKEIPSPPQTLYLLGNVDLLSSISVAIVGTRQSSELGNETAFNLANQLSTKGITIASGLADGIDEHAHKGAINRTIAFVAGGLCQCLQGRKLKLAEEIIKNNGAIVSSYPLDMPVLNYMFLERNELISGISKCTIVVEAPFKSGAINTANHCLNQNKKLFCVPWNINYSKGEGSNKLFLSGAIPLVSYKQIISHIFPSNEQLDFQDFIDDSSFNSTPKIPDEYLPYYQYIKENSPVSLDSIISFFCKKSVAEITSDLFIMEVEGYVCVTDNNYSINNS